MSVPTHSQHPVSRRQALAGLGVLTLATGSGWPTPVSHGRAQTGLSDAELEELLRLARVPSVSAGFVEGEGITMRQVGRRRAGDDARVDADTVYAAASLTKVVFAYTLLGLAREKVLSLDVPVHTYLETPNPDDPRSRQITARHLLSHTGG